MAVLMTGGGTKVNKLVALNYIESSGTQYINTNYIATSENYHIKCKFKIINSETDTVLFGGGDASTDIISALLKSTTQIKFYVGSEFYVDWTAPFTPNAECNLDCYAGPYPKQNINKFTYIIDDEKMTYPYGKTINKKYPLFIFANNISGVASQFSSIQIFSFQIYDNGILVRDFVPALDPDGVVCMYDKVGERYYYNAGNGSFIGG